MPAMPIHYSQVPDLEPALSADLLAWGLALADTKHKMGLRISEWVNAAPALEAAVGAAAITQDELGHARALYSVLRQIPGAPPELGTETDLEQRSEYFYPRLLDKSWKSWPEVVTALVLMDGALAAVFQATEESHFAPLRQRAAKILQEEHFHRIFGDSWLARLAAQNRQIHAGMQNAIHAIWPVALAWFGPDDDRTVLHLKQAGILTAAPHEMRTAWMGSVRPILEKNNFEIPDPRPEGGIWDARRREYIGR